MGIETYTDDDIAGLALQRLRKIQQKRTAIDFVPECPTGKCIIIDGAVQLCPVCQQAEAEHYEWSKK
jgi:hypothetical protein